MFKIDGDLAEETGIHIGDGSMNIYTNGACYTVACHEINEKEYIKNHVAKLVEKIYGIKPNLRKWSEGAYGFRIHSQKVVDFKHKDLNLPLGKKINIKIPERIYENPKLLKRCLRGLFDTDGYLCIEKRFGKPYPRIELHVNSKELIEQVKHALKDMGFGVSVWEHKYAKKNWLTTYNLCVRGRKSLELWMNEIGFKNEKNLKKVAVFKDFYQSNLVPGKELDK